MWKGREKTELNTLNEGTIVLLNGKGDSLSSLTDIKIKALKMQIDVGLKYFKVCKHVMERMRLPWK